MLAAQARETIVPAAHAGHRLDRFLADAYPDLSRSLIQKLIVGRTVTIDGKAAKAATKVEPGQAVRLEIPTPRPTELVPEAVPLQIVYEDEDVAVLDKPAGMVVHPAPGHPTGTLVHALLSRYPQMQIGVDTRPGIVHRLDKDTSGLIVIAKTDRAMASLARQMKDHEVLKEYLVLVHGKLSAPRGIIEGPIGRHPRERKQMAVVATGRPARTHFEVIEYLNGFTLARARLETGRTHQIRVHFAHIGHPVAGDKTYGPRKHELPLDRQFLHAARLGFRLPATDERLELEASLPPDLARVLEYLRGLEGGQQHGEA